MVEFTPHEAPAHESSSLPVAPPSKLIGRDITLGRIYTQIKDKKPVLVHGPAGIGKSALAATLASAYAEQPGGVLYLICGGDTLSELIVRTGRALQVREAVTTENPLNAAAPVAAALRQAQPLLVLDGLLDPEAVTEFVTRCAAGVPVLLVNDEELPGDWMPLRLGKLEPEQAVTLFKQAAGINSLDLDQEIGALASALSFTPFALTVAAGAVHASGTSPRAFLESLPSAPDSGVNAQLLALTGAFRALNSAQQGLMMVMGAVFTGAVTAEMLSLIGGAPVEAIRAAMSQLVARHLAEHTQRYGQVYYRMHPITHTFMQTWLKGANRLDSLRMKVRDSVLQYARQHSAQGSRGQNALAAEMELFLATADWAADAGDRDTAAQLATALMQAGTFVRERGYVYELLLLRRLSTSSTSAFPAYSGTPAASLDEDDDVDLDEIPDDAGLLEDEDTLEDAADVPDDADGDEEDEAVLASEALGDGAPLPFDGPARATVDRRPEIDALLADAKTSEQSGDAEEALKDYAEALALLEGVQDSAGSLTTLESMARVAARSGNYQAAVNYANRGLKQAEESGDDHNKPRLLGFLGDARQQLGEAGEAVTAYEQALALVRARSDHRAEGVLLFKLGYAQLDDDHIEEALETWQESLALFKTEGRRDYEGRALGGIGTAYAEMGRWPEAIEHFTQAVAIARSTEDDAETLLELSNLAYALVQNQQLGPAVLRYRQALHLAFEADDAGSVIATVVELARLLVESPRHLAIAELLVNAALQYDPHDPDLKQLQERIEDERAALPDLALNPIAGTARDYAAKAFESIDSA
ncbi:MAG TPA: tetratricopeptide repeat protein [Candidatus Limnocylindrales bacterium]|nr:tetratricopeptide repeat protein [Candidatus Limnocylindrales bacterium]